MKIIMVTEMLMLGTTMAMFPCLMKDTISVDDVKEFELSGSQVKCVSGCDIMSISSVICHKITTMEQEEAVSSPTVFLSDKPFHCVHSPQLPPDLALVIHSLDCQYCDTSEQQLVHNSCTVRYGLVRDVRTGLYDVMVAMVLVIILTTLLAMLYKEIVDPVHEEKSSLPTGKGEIMTCEFEGGRGERRMDEEIFQQGHSLLGGKRRRRSRSRVKRTKD